MSTEAKKTEPQLSQPSLVSLYDIDDLNAHHCGYCNQNGNVSVGMSSDLMQIEDYQTLIDRGWRRSGTYLYKPVMDKTCCPLYAIKCDALNFKLSKSQKNVLKNVRLFLEKNEIKRKKNEKPEAKAEEVAAETGVESGKKEANKSNRSQKSELVSTARKIKEYVIKNNDLNQTLVDKFPGVKKLKSKQKRLLRKLIELKKKNLINSITDIEKYLKKRTEQKERTLEDYLRFGEKEENDGLKNKLELVLVRSWPPSKEFKETLKEEHEVYTRYQTTVHKDSPLECNLSQFERFLCTSPLMPLSYKGALLSLDKTKPNETEACIVGDVAQIGYGSFHQQYRLNGKIIAVGVIDILNFCVSSVYFFYDPAYHFLNLGTYSALREIAFTRQINKLDPKIIWYYLGFYVHTCPKMRYKGHFNPSLLLCPESYSWHPIEECITLLDVNKYSRFSPVKSVTQKSPKKSKSAAEKTENNDEVDINQVQIRVKFRNDDTRIVKFDQFCDFLDENFVPQFTRLITGYCQLFGPEFSKRVLIKF